MIRLAGEKVVGPTRGEGLRLYENQTQAHRELLFSPHKKPQSFGRSVVQSVEDTRMGKGFFSGYKASQAREGPSFWRQEAYGVTP